MNSYILQYRHRARVLKSVDVTGLLAGANFSLYRRIGVPPRGVSCTLLPRFLEQATRTLEVVSRRTRLPSILSRISWSQVYVQMLRTAQKDQGVLPADLQVLLPCFVQLEKALFWKEETCG